MKYIGEAILRLSPINPKPMHRLEQEAQGYLCMTII